MIWVKIVLAEASIFAACFGFGALIARYLGIRDRDLVLPEMFCLGLLAIGGAGLAVITVGGWLAPTYVPAMLRLVAIVGAVAAACQVKLFAAQPRLLACIVAILLVFTFRNWTFFTNDSFFLHYVVDLAIDRGHLPMEDYGGHFLGHPIWLHVAQIWANALGEPYIRWVFPVAYLLAAWAAVAALRPKAAEPGGWLGIAVIVVLFGSYQMIIQGQMANHHMLVALILLVAGLVLVRDGTLRASVTAGLMLTCIPLMRMEGAMLVGLFAIGMGQVLATPARAAAVAGIPLIGVLPWFAYLAGQRNDGMLSLAQFLLNYAALAMACVGLVGVHLFANVRIFRALRERWYLFCAVVAIGLVAGGAVLNLPVTLSNLSIIPQNMLMFARWGVFWDLSFLVVLALLAAKLGGVGLAKSPFAAFAAVTALVIGLLYFVGAMRGAYRYNWSDSATRMIVHIAPLFAVWLGERLLVLQRAIALGSLQRAGLRGVK